MATQAVNNTPTQKDLEEIQGLVYNSWNKHPYAGFLFATFGPNPTKSRGWLEAVRHHVTCSARHKRPEHGRLQVALSPDGLAALGVPDEVRASLPQEAKDGMANRARIFGDDDPRTWQIGTKPPHALVMVYAHSAPHRAAMLAEQRHALVYAGATVLDDELSFPMEKREHFGFADGLSQPFLPGVHDGRRPGEDAVETGEILLGYRNGYDRLPQSPIYLDGFELGKNGTYLVFRKLHQDVAAFWGYASEQARALCHGTSAGSSEVDAIATRLASKLIGRWPSGASLVLSPHRDDPAAATPERINDFKYLEHDPDGVRCPISSHVRRANPRDARGGTAEDSNDVVSKHRIIRRGRSYGAPLADSDARTGTDDGVARGLYFICLQASLARGFELIQQAWLSNPGFHGLHGEPDPIMGNGDGNASITIPADPLRLRLKRMPRAVTVLGGGYFLLPSLPALERIAQGG